MTQLGSTYRETGRGAEGLLVLPGALGGSETLAPLLSPLGERYRLFFVEYPASGSLDDLVEGLTETLSRRGIGATALLGGSFGGLVAQAFLLRFPERTSRVVLSATGPPDPSRARVNERLLPFLRIVPMGIVRSLLRVGIKKLMKRVSQDRERWLRLYAGAADELTRERLLTLYRIAIDFDRGYGPRIATLESWRGEMLLLAGSEDRLASKKSREALKAAYPRARVEILEGAGHGMALERPEEWREKVISFLSGDPLIS
jgi:pimeloyl-[acyl-carrier protein] methyl ester esterase